MHVSDALIFSFAVKSEGCDQDGNLPQLPDFKTEDIKPFDNCSDFPNGNFVPNVLISIRFFTRHFLFRRSQLRNGHGNGPGRPRRPWNAPRQWSRPHAKQRHATGGRPHGPNGTL